MNADVYSQSRNSKLLLYLAENGITKYDQAGILKAQAEFGYHSQSVHYCAEKNHTLLQKFKSLKQEVGQMKNLISQLNKQNGNPPNTVQTYYYTAGTIGRGENWGGRRD